MLTKRINGSFGGFQKEKDNNDLTDRQVTTLMDNEVKHLICFSTEDQEYVKEPCQKKLNLENQAQAMCDAKHDLCSEIQKEI